jgi:hypothetical protein
VCAYVDRVLRSTQIVGGVVDSKDTVLVHMVADEWNAISFSVGKCMLISIVWNVIIARQ